MHCATDDVAPAGLAGFNSVLSSDDVRVTAAAQVKLAELFGQVDDAEIKAIRVFVQGGGCGGMGYSMTFTDRIEAHDAVYKANGFDLCVDAVALQFLRGVEIDYIDRPMGGSSFVFNNVFKAVGGAGTCRACGSSGGGCG